MVSWTLILLLDYNMLLSFILLLKLSQIWLLETLHIVCNVLSICPYVCFFFLLHLGACGILVPRPEIEHMPPALGAQCLNHRMIREVPLSSFLALQKCSRLFLFSPCSNLGVNHLSKELYLFFFKIIFIEQNLGIE